VFSGLLSFTREGEYLQSQKEIAERMDKAGARQSFKPRRPSIALTQGLQTFALRFRGWRPSLRLEAGTCDQNQRARSARIFRAQKPSTGCKALQSLHCCLLSLVGLLTTEASDCGQKEMARWKNGAEQTDYPAIEAFRFGMQEHSKLNMTSLAK
jgi:hypothetical protein